MKTPATPAPCRIVAYDTWDKQWVLFPHATYTHAAAARRELPRPRWAHVRIEQKTPTGRWAKIEEATS